MQMCLRGWRRTEVRTTRKTRRLGVLATGLVAALIAAGCGRGGPGAGRGPAGASGSAAAEQGGHEQGWGAIPAAAALRTGERFVTLQMPQPYEPVAPNRGTDEYRC